MIRDTRLDAIRGVAVMGILLANIVAFGLPQAAYTSPLAWGGSHGANRAAWFLNAVFVDGRLRGLFSMLFGASMLLVIERAEAAGEPAGLVHLSRMFWLFLFGCVHLYLFWWGDILAQYALVGTGAYAFHRLRAPTLAAVAVAITGVGMAIGALTTAAVMASAPQGTAAQVATWNAVAYGFGVPPAEHLAAEIAALRGGFFEAAAWRWRVVTDPVTFVTQGGLETLGTMLLGMAAWRSGFLSGRWSRRAYATVATLGIAAATVGYAASAIDVVAHGFDQRLVYRAVMLWNAPFRVAGMLGYAAVLVLPLGGSGATTRRLAAVGRMAFSNYLGTTLLMTFVFAGWGLGLFARLERAQLYLLVPPVWGLMLWWSSWCLARYRYGPLEWAWRSLARGERQSMRP